MPLSYLALSGALVLIAPASPQALPLDHLLEDPASARTFDYGALRDHLGGGDLKTLNAEVRDAVAARVAKAPNGCETQAEAFVREGMASTLAASEAAAWRTDWTAATAMLDRLNARTTLVLAGGGAGLPGYGGVRDDLKAAKTAADPRHRELFRRAASDQASREVWKDVWALPQGPRRRMISAPLSAEGCRVDADNTQWLKAEWRRSGWFTAARDGAAASQRAWLIVQHADNDPQFQRDLLPTLARDTDPQSRINYAYLADRVATNANQPQTFGTQGRCVAPDRWEPFPVQDPHGLDARRAALGLPPEAEYATHAAPVCAHYKAPT